MRSIVAIWLTISASGLLFAAVDLWDGAIDLKVLESLGVHDSRALAARRNVRSQAARVGTLGLFTVIGGLAAASFTGPLIAWLLTLSAAVISADAVWDRLSRRRLIAQVRRERGESLSRYRPLDRD